MCDDRSIDLTEVSVLLTCATCGDPLPAKKTYGKVMVKCEVDRCQRCTVKAPKVAPDSEGFDLVTLPTGDTFQVDGKYCVNAFGRCCQELSSYKGTDGARKYFCRLERQLALGDHDDLKNIISRMKIGRSVGVIMFGLPSKPEHNYRGKAMAMLTTGRPRRLETCKAFFSQENLDKRLGVASAGACTPKSKGAGNLAEEGDEVDAFRRVLQSKEEEKQEDLSYLSHDLIGGES